MTFVRLLFKSGEGPTCEQGGRKDKGELDSVT